MSGGQANRHTGYTPLTLLVGPAIEEENHGHDSKEGAFLLQVVPIVASNCGELLDKFLWGGVPSTHLTNASVFTCSVRCRA